MSCLPVTPWLFGKLPRQGDFVSRGLEMGLRDALDRWLSDEMETARAAFLDEFEDRYDAAPAWTFVDCDQAGRWSGGALCASVDAAGRRFPILVGCPADDLDNAAARAGGCLETLYGAFAEGWDADRLHAAEPLAADLGWQSAEPAWAIIAEGGPALVRPGRFPAGIVRDMLELVA